MGAAPGTTTAYDFEVRGIDGSTVPLAQFRGRPLLVVNTASACGFTPQFAGLEELHRTYGGQGLVVLGFPCNQFGAQDPGSNAEIQGFCSRNYGVGFAMMEKIDVRGEHAAPLYRWLVDEKPGFLGTKAVKWNFTKFLIGRDGHVVRRYAPFDKPAQLAADIEAALAAPIPRVEPA
ncbi:glutathione peroxidase [Xylophilus sp.]|uniref:glutathione peroxidase n=1 Tax=Xylophilus sp. TaxID=2653893 RepID=UPI0013BB2D0E|nr:glutathione peroxidase [Xylophilus sp.]KAF1050297.1 MAG: Glutathione peroxidase BsaA [Xylophilus sp.]